MVDRTRELAPAATATLDASAHSRLRGDPARLRQVLDNLLNNTRHATPSGGHITVRISNQRVTADVERSATSGPASRHPPRSIARPAEAAPPRERPAKRKPAAAAGRLRLAAEAGGVRAGLPCRAWMP